MAASVYTDFLEAVGKKNFPPVTLLFGEEDFLIEECVNGVISSALDEGTKGFNLDVLYGSKTTAKDAMGIASSFPMMSGKRVVVIKEFERLANGDPAKDTLANYIARPLESTVLLLIAEDPDFRKKPFTDLKKHATLVECKPLYDNQVPGWIGGHIKKRKKDADGEACRMLHAYVGNSLRALSNEVEKLFLFVGDRAEIRVDDVVAVVGASKGFTVFDLQHAIGKRNITESIRILQRMLEYGESPQLIIVMLTRFFTQLAKIVELKQRRTPDAEIAAKFRIPPFYFKNWSEAAANYSIPHIESCFAALLSADAEMKSTSRDPVLVMELLLYSLIRGSSQLANAGHA